VFARGSVICRSAESLTLAYEIASRTLKARSRAGLTGDALATPTDATASRALWLI
jgi:hypothetical protein